VTLGEVSSYLGSVNLCSHIPYPFKQRWFNDEPTWEARVPLPGLVGREQTQTCSVASVMGVHPTCLPVYGTPLDKK